MKILIACEESQVVTTSFRKLGYEAWSCDLKETRGQYPQYHYKMSVEKALVKHEWDAVIAFPPCTNLCASGARWWAVKRQNGSQRKSMDFFMLFTKLKVPHIAIENPIGIMSTEWKKPKQIIQPWQFGHGETKATCLWLKGLPKLQSTNVVSGRETRVHKMSPCIQRSRERSKTYQGIADAMAFQWGAYIEEKEND